MLKIIISRLKEASTWAGISALFLANALIMGGDYQPLLGACGLVSGCFAIVLREKGHVD